MSEEDGANGDNLKTLGLIMLCYEKHLEFMTAASIEIGEARGMSKEQIMFFLTSITMSLGAAIAADRDSDTGGNEAHKMQDEMYNTALAMLKGEAANPVAGDRVH